jgi:hypothetical protein
MLQALKRLIPGAGEEEEVEPATGIEARKLKHRKRKLRKQIKDLEGAVEGSCSSCMKTDVPAGARMASKQLRQLKERKARIEKRLEAGREVEDD